jgi:ABC-type transport system involved in cytochrome c biogenesis ATPase subunit
MSPLSFSAECFMIKEIDIRNFKCFGHLHVSNCCRVNVIVGDNGVGKTALLEGVFFALASTSEVVLRFRQFRGLDGQFRGSSRKIEEAIWRDYFHGMDMNKTISISLHGDGPEARSVSIERGAGQTLVPLDQSQSSGATSGIIFKWRDQLGKYHEAIPEISISGIKFPETGEDLADFFFLSSNQTFSSTENADRFSDMNEDRRREFVAFFKKQYPVIQDLFVRSMVGAPAIYAQMEGIQESLPITAISGGINRMITLLLMIASRKQSVVLIDEIENGIFHTHLESFWRILLNFSNNYHSQIFVTTHSEECLEALAKAIDVEKNDVSLWRASRQAGSAKFKQFFGKQVPIGIKAGEVR